MAIIKIKNQAIDLDAAEIPNLSANKITSDTLADARIPANALNSNIDLTNLSASNLTSGTVADARLPANALNSNIDLTNLSATNMTSGTLPNARFGTPTFNGSNITNLPAGGKILQVLAAFKPARQSISATSYTDVSNMSVTITPASSSSKIFVTATINAGANAAYEGYINLVKNSTAIMQPSSSGSGSTQLCSLPHRRINNNDVNAGVGLVFLDSPSTTSSTTYKIQAKMRSGGVMVFGGASDTGNGDFWSAPCSIVVMEVGA